MIFKLLNWYFFAYSWNSSYKYILSIYYVPGTGPVARYWGMLKWIWYRLCPQKASNLLRQIWKLSNVVSSLKGVWSGCCECAEEAIINSVEKVRQSVTKEVIFFFFVDLDEQVGFLKMEKGVKKELILIRAKSFALSPQWNLWSRYYCFHFADEETKASRD